MLHFFITMAGAFAGSVAASVFLNMYNATARSDALVSPAERAPGSKRATLAAGGAFAVVAGLIFYLISTGHMHTGLGAIAAVVTLITLALVARALR
jgi:hypothetical protein